MFLVIYVFDIFEMRNVLCFLNEFIVWILKSGEFVVVGCI